MIPPLEPGQCGNCGLSDRPVVHERCDLCAAVFGAGRAPEHIASILPRVLESLQTQRGASTVLWGFGAP